MIVASGYMDLPVADGLLEDPDRRPVPDRPLGHQGDA
jgi:hypothetical protein